MRGAGTRDEMEEEMNKPNCYKCQYRADIPGNAHSMCIHPETKLSKNSNTFSVMMNGVVGKYAATVKKLGIVGHPTGIKRGWFLWPANFDPVWLLNCDGFLVAERER